MKTAMIAAILLISMQMIAQEVYDFSPESKSGDWIVVDDGVMGGRSQGNVGLSEEGHGIFQGTVSLENNGGFSSIRVRMEELETEAYSAFKIRDEPEFQQILRDVEAKFQAEYERVRQWLQENEML